MDMMEQPTAQQKSAISRAASLYSLGIGLAGWLWLLLNTDWGALRADLWSVLLFAALSWMVKGFRLPLAGSVAYRPFDVVELAAVWVFGPHLGAWAAALSSLVYVALPTLRDRRQCGPSVGLEAIFSSGLAAVLAMTCGELYKRLGGTTAPAVATWTMLLPLFAAMISWFALSFALRAGRILLRDGSDVTLQFVQGALPLALLIELLPLPLSYLVALAYVGMGAPALALSAVALAAARAAVQRLEREWNRLRARVTELGVLNEFGRSLVEAQSDVDELCQLLYEHCLRVVDAPIFVLELVQADQERVDVAVHVENGKRRPRQTLPLTETMKWMAKNREPFLSGNVPKGGLPFEPHVLGQLPRSIVLVPLLAGPDLIGALSVQSHEAQAFDPDDVSVLSAMGNQAAMAIGNARAFEAAQRRARQLAAISQVGQRVAAVLELNELFAYVVQLIRETFGYDHVGLFTVDVDTGEVVFQASTDPIIQEQGVQVSQHEGILAWVAESGESLLANDVSMEPRYRCAGVLPETKAELAVPLKVEERIVGVLDVQSNEVDAFSRDDLFVLQTLADQVAIAVEDARLYTARQEEAWSSTALLQVAQAVSRLDSLDEILDTTVRLAPTLVGVDRCTVVLWQEDAQEFVTAAGYAIREELGPLLAERRLQPGEVPLLDRLRADRMPILLEERNDSTPDTLVRAFGAMLALPLWAQGQFEGALLADYADPQSVFSDRRWTILSGIGDQVAVAIANARLDVAQREEAWVSTALLQVAQALASSNDLDDSLSRIVRLIPLLVGADHCMVLLWDEPGAKFVPGAAHGLTKRAEKALQSLYLERDEVLALHEAIEQRRPVMLGDVERDNSDFAWLSASLDCRCGLIMPLVSKSEMLGALLAGYAEGARHFSDRNVSIVEGIGHQTAIAIENARLYEATLEQERTAQELRMAREIQVSFLPAECPSLPGWEIEADWRAARGVGGDFYDFIPLGAGRIGLVIADVSDKGMPAALFMSLCRTLVRASATDIPSPAKALQRVNELLMAENRSGMFLTAFYGVLDWRTGQLTFANAGHNPPLLQRQVQLGVLPLTSKGVVLGVLDNVALEERRIVIEPGDMLMLYTDGVTEPINGEEEEFGEHRLIQVMTDNFDQPCAQIVEVIYATVSDFVGAQPQFDDYTLVALKRVS
jgi:sigma-B regulation protein RsbU (phosphoserine phosphatase)